jgi:hypothetical protein
MLPVKWSMLYYLNSTQSLKALPSSYHVTIKESTDVEFLSVIMKISSEEVTRRLANDNNAYVAFYKNQPAAFGWSASGKAFIGELNHELILPLAQKYLWNFRIFENFRGLGIYPQLLQHIVRSESHTTECFWILHSPENKASQKGIAKAGFQFVSEVSVKNLDSIVVRDHQFQYSDDLNTMGFTSSEENPATCWTCSSPYLNHKRTECCCASSTRHCNEKQFRPV